MKGAVLNGDLRLFNYAHENWIHHVDKSRDGLKPLPVSFEAALHQIIKTYISPELRSPNGASGVATEIAAGMVALRKYRQSKGMVAKDVAKGMPA